MKIRRGFVSNSSSCSFLIYGITGEEDKLLSGLKSNNIIPEEENNFGEWIWSGEANKILKDKNLELEVVSDYDEYVYIGRSWDKIKDDETGKQFKENIEKSIKELFGDDFESNTHKCAWENR